MSKSILEMEPESSAKIIELDGSEEFKRKLATLNIRIGKTIKKIAMQPFRGPIIIEVDATKVTIGRGIASKIIVEY
ncbi:MAG: FeoA family protein [Candidatus Woesearchaeota archaeon]